MLFLTSPASPASSKLLGMILHTAFFYFCIVFAVAETTKQSLKHWCQWKLGPVPDEHSSLPWCTVDFTIKNGKLLGVFAKKDSSPIFGWRVLDISRNQSQNPPQKRVPGGKQVQDGPKAFRFEKLARASNQFGLDLKIWYLQNKRFPWVHAWISLNFVTFEQVIACNIKAKKRHHEPPTTTSCSVIILVLKWSLKLCKSWN